MAAAHVRNASDSSAGSRTSNGSASSSGQMSIRHLLGGKQTSDDNTVSWNATLFR